MVKRHLPSDGILQIWYPWQGDNATLASVTKALTVSFPHVKAYLDVDPNLNVFGIHFLASMSPLPDTPSSVLAARMPPAAVADFVEWGPGKTAQQQFERVVSHRLPLQPLIEADPRVAGISDDRPVNEYYFLRKHLHIRQ